MKCRDFENMMLLYFDGQLSDEDCVCFENHIGSCGKCRSQYGRIAAVYSGVEAERGDFRHSQFLAQKLMYKVQNTQSVTLFTNKWGRYVLYPLTLVAALFVGFLLGSFYINVNRNSSTLVTQIAIERISEQYIDGDVNNPYIFQVENSPLK